MTKNVIFILICLWAVTTHAQPEVSVNGLFAGKAIIVIDGKPTMFYEGDKKKGVKLVSANETYAVVVIKGKRHQMVLDQSIANAYSKPVKIVPYGVGVSNKNEITKVELVHQTDNIATFMVAYKFDDAAPDYHIVSKVMVEKEASDYVTYNYVPLKKGEHTTHISLGIDESAPAEFQSDHVLMNFSHTKSKREFDAENAKIIPFKKQWQH